ncbi:MAG: hypothetical protein ABJL44_10610 [Algibacter sp.]
MSIPSVKKTLFIIVFSALFLIPLLGTSQPSRIKVPKRMSKITTTDKFVSKTFELYNKVFIYDSLTIAGVEIPGELEDELMESAVRDIDSLWEVVPDIIDDISDASFMKQAKATLNLNKAKKALKYCGNYMKSTVVGKKEDEE